MGTKVRPRFKAQPCIRPIGLPLVPAKRLSRLLLFGQAVSGSGLEGKATFFPAGFISGPPRNAHLALRHSLRLSLEFPHLVSRKSPL